MIIGMGITADSARFLVGDLSLDEEPKEPRLAALDPILLQT
jgi:hypothetical protein